MLPILYDQIVAGVVPEHNGLGVLSDCISCEVEQERNGAYELTMQYPRTGIHADEIANRRLLKVKPNFTDDPQLFRIDRITKEMNGVFTVYAKHISYDLSGYEIITGTANSATSACVLFENNADGYTFSTDKTVSANFEISTPASVKSYFSGKQGSFLDVFGTAEIKYDNFDVKFLLHAGQDRGVTIQYGKNLLELSQESSDTLFTHVMCYYKSDDAKVVGDKKPTGIILDVPKTLILDRTEDFDAVPTVDDLNNKAIQYIDNNNLTTPSNNITLNFAQSEDLTGRVDLCDTVTVYYEALGITRTNMKCIRTKWDCIREKYIETEFGDPKTTIVDTVAVNTKEITKKVDNTELQKSINNATQLITGNLGGYVVIHDANGDGEPDEILIMNTDDINTATKIWRWNSAGLGYSSTGYSGQYGTAITANGEIVADFITVGTMSANLIRGGVLQLGSNLNQSGELHVFDEQNNLIAEMNKDGLMMYGIDGFYIKINPTVGFSGYDRNNNRLFWVDEDEFHMKKAVIEEQIILCHKNAFVPITLRDANDNITNDGIGLVSVM